MGLLSLIQYHSLNSWHRHLHWSVRSLRLLLAMATPVRQTCTTDVGQLQRRRHHMTARGLQFSSFTLSRYNIHMIRQFPVDISARDCLSCTLRTWPTRLQSMISIFTAMLMTLSSVFTVDLRKLLQACNYSQTGTLHHRHGQLDVCKQAQVKYGQDGAAVGWNKIQHVNVEWLRSLSTAEQRHCQGK